MCKPDAYLLKPLSMASLLGKYLSQLFERSRLEDKGGMNVRVRDQTGRMNLYVTLKVRPVLIRIFAK